jgi:hypothetical protein
VSLKHFPLLVCALAALTASAGAQFTAVVAPPPAKSKVDTIAKQDSVRHATIALAARVTDMRKWVDSAAGVSIVGGDSTSLASKTADTATTAPAAPQMKDSVVLSRNARIRADSAASIATVEVHDSTGLKGSDSAATAVPPTPGRRSRAGTKTVTGGAPAPATATMLPFLAITGVTTLLAGLALRRR